MKKLVKTSRTAGYLEKIFRALNEDFFSGELEEPIITIQSTKGAYGHVTISKVWKSENGQRHELNIGADTMNRPIENIVATMLHEMVHLYNLQHEIKDTSRSYTYHNKKFKTKAESVGLIIEHNDKIGWSITSPSEELIDYIISKDWEEISLNRGLGFSPRPDGAPKTGGKDGEDEDGEPKKKSSTRKLVCPCCGCSVRATKKVRIMCMDCMEEMTEV